MEVIRRPLHISEASVRELLRLHAEVMDELRERKVVRTGNSPLGDYAELLFKTAFGWHFEANSSAGYDATDQQRVRYQIKARRLTPHNRSRQLSAIRRLPEAMFDSLAAVLVNERYEVTRAILLPHYRVAELAKRVEQTNSWRFMLEEGVWQAEGARDVTSELQRAAELI